MLRGAGFAFRKESETLRWQRLLGATFAFSSLVTPFFMGTVIGSIVAGKISPNARHASLGVWTSPTSLLMGALFVVVCAYLAAIFLTREARRRHDESMLLYFSRRAEVAAVVAGLLSLSTLLELRHANPVFFHGLTHRALALVVVAALCGVVALALLARQQATGLRLIAAIGVVCVVWGWGVAQYPLLLPGTSLTLADGAAPRATLEAIVVLFVTALVLVVPSFVILFTLQGRQLLSSEETK